MLTISENEREEYEFRVVKIKNPAIVRPNEGIQIPVPIEVGQGRGAIIPHIYPNEGISQADYFVEDVPVIAKEVNVTIPFPNEGIQISIPIEINKGRGTVGLDLL
jgi:hypothetical protein